MRKIIAKVVLVIPVVIMGGTRAYAYDVANGFTLDGFGYQDYRQTSANRVDYVGQTGNGVHNFLGLLMVGQLTDRSKLWAQLQANTTNHPNFTWLFLDWQFTDSVTGHVGRVKFPFGLINEYIDNKALQMTLTLPFAVSESADMTYDSYTGVGLDWNTPDTSWGNSLLQGFFGNTYTSPAPILATTYPNNPPVAIGPASATQTQPTTDLHLLGGRVTWNTPLTGLRFMLSGSVTEVGLQPLALTPANYAGLMTREYRLMYSAEYRRDGLWVQSEYNLHRFPGGAGYVGIDAYSAYVQAGVTVGKFLPYIRAQTVVTNQNLSSNPNFYQQQWSVGSNYALLANLNVRLELDRNHGFAMPIASQGSPYYPPGAMLAPGVAVPALNWNEVGVEMNFTF